MLGQNVRCQNWKNSEGIGPSCSVSLVGASKRVFAWEQGGLPPIFFLDLLYDVPFESRAIQSPNVEKIAN